MPVRYTCRVSVLRAGPDTFRLTYAPLDLTYTPRDEMPVRLLTIHGPAMVVPPDAEMTAAELDRWEFDFTCGTGYSFSYRITPESTALVEAHRTIEDMIPKGAVRWRLLPMQHGDNGTRTFAVELRNAWGQQIPRITLATCWEKGTPQPHPTAPASMGVVGLGGSDSVFRRMTPVGSDALPPNYPVPFLYPPEFLPAFRSRAAALSPERYWVALRTDGHEFDRIPGPEVSAFLDALDD